MRILVTGGAGYIGSHTVKLLLACGHTSRWPTTCRTATVRRCRPDRLIIGDLKDVDQLDHVFVVNRIEAVVHFAAYAYVGESVTNPAKYYQNNLLNSLFLLERVRRHGSRSSHS